MFFYCKSIKETKVGVVLDPLGSFLGNKQRNWHYSLFSYFGLHSKTRKSG